MIVAVISDTHLSWPSRSLENVMKTVLLPADLLLHCGDIISEEVWAYLHSHPRFYAVQGNCDLPPLRGSLPALREVDIAGWRVGMAHGWGPRPQVWQVVAEQFPNVDLICYGHTHIRDWRQLADGRWILNPGSFLWPRDGQAGLALLHLAQGQVPHVDWINLDTD